MSDFMTEFDGEIDTEFVPASETIEEISEPLEELGVLETTSDQECTESFDELTFPDSSEIFGSTDAEGAYNIDLATLDSVTAEVLGEVDAEDERIEPLMTLSLAEVQDIVGSEKDTDTLRNLRDKIESGEIAVVSGENSDEGRQLTLQPQSYTREIR